MFYQVSRNYKFASWIATASIRCGVLFWLCALLLTTWQMLATPAFGEVNAPGSYERLRTETALQIRSRLNPVLHRYCGDACEIVNVDVEVSESFNESDDIGFESIVGAGGGSSVSVTRASVDVQVDERVTSANREKLEVILNNNLRAFGPLTSVRWVPVQLPQIGQADGAEEELKRSVQQKVWTAVQKVIDAYCPDQCVLARVGVDGRIITPDQATSIDQRQIEKDRSGRGVLKIDQVDVEVSIDEGIPEQERNKISNVMRARTRFVDPVQFEISVSAFPQADGERKARAADPFGLEKLRETLKIFREMAGTKEVITREQSTTNNTSTATESSKQTVSSNSTSSAETKEATRATNIASSSQSSQGEIQPIEYALYIGAFLLLAAMLIALVMRFAGARKEAQVMMASATPQRSSAPNALGYESFEQGHANVPNGPPLNMAGQSKELAARARVESLKNELVGIFLQSPKVAKETFTRMLLDDGAEYTAKYVYIFGHMVVFELLDDPNVQRDLYSLTEYYQKSRFAFTSEEEIDLLEALKMRVTANEIRVLSRKQTQHFDFLAKLDASQIFNLVRDEKPQIQSIVLTQLDQKRRRGVFEMYQGDAKVSLMRELCRADAIPKEFLVNVARVLHKKVLARPEFDTENLRSSDILLDLMERAVLDEQHKLMRDLARTNPDAARGIKLRLVTIETLPYLKDGHLLELVLGMERHDLLTFLAGTREHIRDLFLNKAPHELAQSWVEELEQVSGVDEQNYRLTELKVIGRVRQLANNGAINILAINDVIFGTGDMVGQGGMDREVAGSNNDYSSAAAVA